MRQVSIFLMAIALAPAVIATVEGRGMVVSADKEWTVSVPRSRFLASVGSKAEKCDMNPLVCLSMGSAGPSCCGQQCVNMNKDDFNCGKCGKVCKFRDSCCGGKCEDLAFDKRHCGSCGNKCKNGVLCIYGMCNYGS